MKNTCICSFNNVDPAFNSCKKDEPYNQYTDTAIATLQKCYNTETGLYKTTSWWNGLSI